MPLSMATSIAILCRGNLGEILCGLPLLFLCRQRFPDAKFTLFIDEEGSALLPYLQQPHRIVVIPKSAHAQWKKGWELRKEKFDFTYSTPKFSSQKRDFFSYLLRAKHKESYLKNELNGRKHQAVKSLNLVDPEYVTVPSEFFPKLARVPCFAFAEKTLLMRISNEDLNPQEYHSILRRLYEKVPFRLILSARRKDCEKGKAICETMQLPCQVMVTDQTEEFLQLLASVDGFFASDLEAIHLAAALGIPQVALFEGSKVWKYGPLSNKAICLEHAEDIKEIPEEEIEMALERLIR